MSKVFRSFLAVIVAFGLALPTQALLCAKQAWADTTEPTIEVVRIGENDAVIVGDEIQYYVIIHNNNTKYQGGIQATHELSEGLEFISADTDSGTYDTQTNTWTTGIIDAKGQAALTVTAKVTKAANTLDEVKHTATLVDGGTAELVTAVAHFNVTKTRVGEDTGIKKGDVVSYKIDVENTSKSSIRKVNVTDTMSAGLIIKSATTTSGKFDESTKVWTTGKIEANATATLNVDCVLDEGVSVEEVSNSVVNISTDETSKVTSEVAKFSISAEKTSVDEAVKVDDEITYDVKIKNEKSKPITDVNVSTELSQGLELVSATTDCGSVTDGVWTSGSIAGNSEAVLHVVAKVTKDAKRLNTVTFSYASTQVDDKGSIESEVAAWTLEKARTQVDGTNFEEAVKMGDLVVYSVKVTNYSEHNVSGIKVIEDFTQGLEYVDATTESGTFADNIWTTGVIEPNATAEVIVITKATEDVKTVSDVINNVKSEQNDTKATVETETVRYTMKTNSENKEAVKIGDEITYTVIIKNKNKLDFSGITVNSVLSDGLVFKSAEIENGEYDEETNTWTTDVVESKDTAELTINAIVTDAAFGKDNVTNTFTSEYNDLESVVKTEVASWEVNAERINNNLAIWNGDIVDGKVVVKNTSDNAISGVKVQVVGSKSTIGLTTTGETGSGIFYDDVWTTGVIESGQEVMLTIHQIATGVENTYGQTENPTMSFNSYVMSMQLPSDITDTTVTETYGSDFAVPVAHVVFDVTCENSDVAVWTKDKVIYKVTLKNCDNVLVNGTGVKIKDILPEEDVLEIKKGVTENGTFDKANGLWLTDVLDGEATLTVTCKVTDDVDELKALETTTIDNTFVCEQTGQSVTVPVVLMSGALSMELVTDVTNGVRVGDELEYKVTLANHALAAMENVNVIDTVSEGLELEEFIPETGTFDKEKMVWTVDHIDSATLEDDESSDEDITLTAYDSDDETSAVEIIPTETTATVKCKVTEDLGDKKEVTHAVMVEEDSDSKVELTTAITFDEVIDNNQTDASANAGGTYQTVSKGNNGGSGSGSSSDKSGANLQTAADNWAVWVMLFAVSAAAASGACLYKKRRMLAGM